MRLLATFLVFFAAFYFVQAQEGSGDGTTERPAYCSLHPDEGTSTDGNFVIYLYYDESTDKCSLFKYFGTGGNDNRFEAEVYCMRNCSPSAESIYPADRRQGCVQKKNVGECMGQYMRYYYDAIHQKCHSFFWTGCVGNGNRFLDMATCNATCQGVSDQGDDLEEEEHDTPVGLILGVILGLAGAAILVVVAVLAVKSKPSKGNKPPKATPRSAAPVVRSDEDIEMRPSDD